MSIKKTISHFLPFFFAASILHLQAAELSDAVQLDYNSHLGELFEYFHSNPELSFLETNTAARIVEELRATGLTYASTLTQIGLDGNELPVMHACGHDVHITSLIGTARIMADNRDQWSGTLMLIGQPAEEAVSGASAMRDAGIWEQFGVPDYALAFHVTSLLPTGTFNVVTDSPFSGADPIVLGSQIVMALQTLITRELAPRESGVITVGSFQSGMQHNIISDQARLQLTVRHDNSETRETLLSGIRRIAENMGRVAGLSEADLPEVIVSEDSSVPPTINDMVLTLSLRSACADHFGEGIFIEAERKDMVAEDFSFFTVVPYISSTYFLVGGTLPLCIPAGKCWLTASAFAPFSVV